jgi:hypothetical protein
MKFWKQTSDLRHCNEKINGIPPSVNRCNNVMRVCYLHEWCKGNIDLRKIKYIYTFTRRLIQHDRTFIKVILKNWEVQSHSGCPIVTPSYQWHLSIWSDDNLEWIRKWTNIRSDISIKTTNLWPVTQSRTVKSRFASKSCFHFQCRLLLDTF